MIAMTGHRSVSGAYMKPGQMGTRFELTSSLPLPKSLSRAVLFSRWPKKL